ncbi:MAG: hypothetical protein KC416_09250, partial [Myxococcales bacterium]|nr:hypothetical protein [Myxococcales bacterium]
MVGWNEDTMRVPGTHRGWRKWLFLFSFLLIGLPLTLALFTVYTPWGRDRIKHVAVETIHDELGLRLGLRHLNVELLPPAVTAYGITLDDPQYGRFAEADALTIRPSFLAFFRGTLDLDEIRLTGPTLNLIWKEGRIVNLPKPRKGSGGTSAPDEIPVGRVIISGAQVYLDAAPHGQASLEGVGINLEVTDKQLVHVDVRTVSGTFKHEKGVEQLLGLHAKGRVSSEGIDIDEFRTASTFFRIHLKDGHLPLPIDNNYQGKALVRVDLGHLAQLPLDISLPTLRGTFEVEGEVTGTRDGPEGAGTVRIRGVMIDQWGLGDMDLPVVADREKVTIRKGQARLIDGGGAIDLDAELGLGGEFPLSVKLNLKDMEFHKLMAQLGISNDAVVQWIVSGDIGVSGTINPLKLNGPLAISTRDFLVTAGPWHGEGVAPIVGVGQSDLRGRVAVTPTSLSFLDIHGNAGQGSTLQGGVVLGFGNHLRVNATIDPLDLSDASPLIDFPLTGKGRTEVVVDGPYDNPTLGGSISLQGFSFDGLAVGDVTSDFVMENNARSVRFPEIAVQKNESELLVRDFVLDFRDERFLTEAFIEADRLDLRDVFHAFNYTNDERFDRYSGLLRGDAHVRYTRGFPDDLPSGTLVTDIDMDVRRFAIGDFTFDGGHARGRWNWHDMTRGYRGGTLTIAEATLRKGPGTLGANGVMHPGGQLALTAAIDRFAISQSEGIRELLPGIGGNYSAVATVEGTMASPRADVDLTLSGLTYGNLALGDARTYVRLTDKSDPWIAQARTWNPNALPSEPCARGRHGFATTDWPADPPLRTREGPLAPLDQPMAFLVCGTALGG